MNSCLSFTIAALLFLHKATSQNLPCSLLMESEHKCIKALYATTPEDPIVSAQDPVFLRCLNGFEECIAERTAINDCRKEIDRSVESDATFQDIMSTMEISIDGCFQNNPSSEGQYNGRSNNYINEPQPGGGNEAYGYGSVENRRRHRRQASGFGQVIQGQQQPSPMAPALPPNSACNIKPNKDQENCLRDGMAAIQNNETLHKARIDYMKKRRELDQQVMTCRNHVPEHCRPQPQNLNLMQCLCPATEIFQKEVYDRNEICVSQKLPNYEIQPFSTRCRSPGGPLYPVQES